MMLGNLEISWPESLPPPFYQSGNGDPERRGALIILNTDFTFGQSGGQVSVQQVTGS